MRTDLVQVMTSAGHFVSNNDFNRSDANSFYFFWLRN